MSVVGSRQFEEIGGQLEPQSGLSDKLRPHVGCSKAVLCVGGAKSNLIV